jgi:hypothetical protein
MVSLMQNLQGVSQPNLNPLAEYEAIDHEYITTTFGPLPAKKVDFRARDRERARDILLSIRLMLDAS